jgi:hypothetical protein
MRCYDGAWDDEARAMFAQQDKLLSEIRKLEPFAHCTYFPSEGLYQVHAWGIPLSEMRRSKMDALREARCKLHEEHDGEEAKD